MLVGPSLIFVHNPRAGGTSVREYLQRVVPGRYFPVADPKLSNADKSWLIHQGLEVCYQYATRSGFDPFSIPTLVVIRNPYSLSVSAYLYLAQRHGKKIRDMEQTFEQYLANLIAATPAEQLEAKANAEYGPFSTFLTLGGVMPSNLTVARTETLRENVEAFVKGLAGAHKVKNFPHTNRSEHEHFSQYFGKTEEEMVYRMYKNTFESGLYKRFEGLEV